MQAARSAAVCVHTGRQQLVEHAGYIHERKLQPTRDSEHAMTSSNGIVAALSEQDSVALAAHVRMRRVLAAVDVLHGKWNVDTLQAIAAKHAALFIHEQETGNVRMQLDGMELFFNNTGAVTLRWLTAVQDPP